MRIVFLALTAVFLSGSVCSAAGSGKVRIPSLATDTTEIDGYLLRPDGPGPFPAVVALHGCAGLWGRDGSTLTSRHADWGERLRRAGYAVLFPDSFGSRGHKNLCKVKNRPVKHSHRIGDLRGAADWLASHPFIDAGKIALIGWSNGGTSALRALEPDKAPERTEFRTAIAFYPACRWAIGKPVWTPRLKPLVLIGSADDWTPAEPCKQLARNWEFRLVLYEGAYHTFDAPDIPVRVLKGRAFSANKDGTVHVGTDLRARIAAITEVMNHLKAVFSSAK